MTNPKTVRGKGRNSNNGSHEIPNEISHKVCTMSRIPKSALTEKLVIGREIGSGGMGTVNEAYDPILRRAVAVKKPHSHLPPHVLQFVRNRLIEEAQITAQLDHPNIVPVHELCVDENGEIYFSMKRVQGRELADILQDRTVSERSRQELFDNLQIFLKVCDTVAFAHSVGVIHRDLKPANVMVGDFGIVYLMDWGIARSEKAPQRGPEKSTQPDEIDGRGKTLVQSVGGAGTPIYMAPEQISQNSAEIDERTDIFLLGGILYEILTHQPPYAQDSNMILLEMGIPPDIVPPNERVPEPLPSRLCDIATKALQQSKTMRYQTVQELKRDVEDFIQCWPQFERRMFEPGELVFNENDVGHEAFVIEKGRCIVFKTISGKKTVLRVMEEGESFGEIAVLTGGTRTASVEAVEKLCLLVIKRTDFTENLGMRPLLATFLENLAKRFAEKDAELTKLTLENERLRAEINQKQDKTP